MYQSIIRIQGNLLNIVNFSVVQVSSQMFQNQIIYIPNTKCLGQLILLLVGLFTKNVWVKIKYVDPKCTSTLSTLFNATASQRYSILALLKVDTY